MGRLMGELVDRFFLSIAVVSSEIDLGTVAKSDVKRSCLFRVPMSFTIRCHQTWAEMFVFLLVFCHSLALSFTLCMYFCRPAALALYFLTCANFLLLFLTSSPFNSLVLSHRSTL